MPIPNFQTLMLPYLQFMGDGKPHNTAEDYLADIFKVTDARRYVIKRVDLDYFSEK
jgi:restriction endonuclease Mrr